MVKYTVTVEPEFTSVRGNVMCTDDAELDKQAEDEIIARLNRGEVEAWCVVGVEASCGGLTGRAYLGGNTLDDTYTADVVAKEHGLHEEALADLRARLKAASEAYADLK